MYKPLMTLSLLTLFLVPVAFAEDWPSVPFLVVEGKASVDVPPEKATIALYVAAFEKESEVAVATVQQQVTQVLEVLERFEVPLEAITSFSIRKDVERARQEHRDLEILGYYVSRRIKAELSDISRFSDLVGALAGLDNVSKVDATFEIKNRDDVETQLTRRAATDARRKAENMAAAMGVSIGNVHAISATEFRSGGTIYRVSARAPASVASMRSLEDTVFMPATIAIRQSLHVVFEIDQ